MTLVFTSKERKQQFEKAISLLSSINRSARAFWDDAMMRLSESNNKRDAELIVREMLGALHLAYCFAWEDWFTRSDLAVIIDAENALVWSDFE